MWSFDRTVHLAGSVSDSSLELIVSELVLRNSQHAELQLVLPYPYLSGSPSIEFREVETAGRYLNTGTLQNYP